MAAAQNNNNNAFNFAISQNPDLALQQAQLAYKQKIANALLDQGMEPLHGTQMAGNVAIRTSPLEGIAKMFQAYAGRKGLEENASETGALNHKIYEANAALDRGVQQPQATPEQFAMKIGANSTGQAGPTSQEAMNSSDWPKQNQGVAADTALDSINSGQIAVPPPPPADNHTATNPMGIDPKQWTPFRMQYPDKAGDIIQKNWEPTEQQKNYGYFLNKNDPSNPMLPSPLRDALAANGSDLQKAQNQLQMNAIKVNNGMVLNDGSVSLAPNFAGSARELKAAEAPLEMRQTESQQPNGDVVTQSSLMNPYIGKLNPIPGTQVNQTNKTLNSSFANARGGATGGVTTGLNEKDQPIPVLQTQALGINDPLSPTPANDTVANIQSNLQKKMGGNSTVPAIPPLIGSGQKTQVPFGLGGNGKFQKVSEPIPSGLSQADQKFKTENADNLGKYYADTKTRAAASPDNLNALSNIEKIVNGDTKTGPGQQNYIDTVATARGLIPNSKGLSDVQVLQKYTEKLLRGQRRDGSTDSDLASITKANITPEMTNAAIKELLPNLKARELANQAEANAANSWLEKNGNDHRSLSKFQTSWNNNYDPRIFIASQMPPQERGSYLKSQKDSSELINKAKFFHGQGWIK